MNESIAIADETVIDKIYTIRGKKVMLDRDLALMYGVETRRLNEQVKRNAKRFPIDFMFQLTESELENWMSQNAISNKEKMGLRKLPNVFTEQGVAMLSSVLNSETAIEVNIQIIRIFTRIREILSTHKDILVKMEQLEKNILKQDKKAKKHEEEIQLIFNALKQLLNPPQEPRKPIGFRMGGKKTE
ncbi:MAG: ORF6N domain-containing protein [Bacteroidetes bacterium]|nr:ORF6N domain-containing protein [Bacteroidota bacterium]